jgi:outer membrane receptor protein involved in Fe transport
MNAAVSSAGQVPGSAVTSSNIDLRGLGFKQTLILVDGRRMPGIPNFGSALQPDLNGIPLSAIERIEILPATAGGIYGGGATAGVVNIILRRNYEGIDAKVSFGNSFRSDATYKRVDASAGFTLEGGRTHIMVAASYEDADDLLVGDRNFAARSRALQLKNNPDIADFTVSSAPPSGATPNIHSSDGSSLMLDPEYGGADLQSSITHIPLGYAGPASDNGAALLANAGRYNLDLSNDTNGLRRGLLATPQTDSVSLNARREFGSRVEAFVDVSRSNNEGTSYSAFASNLAFGLPADAPNNPFQQDINVRFSTPGLQFQRRTESNTTRATGGVIVRLPHEWTGEIDYGWSRSRYSDVGTNSIVDVGASIALSTGLPSDDGRPALNALQEGNTFPLDLAPYLLPSPNQFFGPYESILRDTTLRVSGPTLQLPGGALTLSALLEHRDEELEDALNQGINIFTGTPTYSFIPHRSQKVDSYHVEARAPLVSQRNSRRGVQELELQLSVRRDEYETMGTDTFSAFLESREDPLPEINYVTSKFASTDYSAGLRYAPVEDLALRASFSTGFLPPDVNQIAPTPSIVDFPFGYIDPKRGDTDSYAGQPFTEISSGNPNLRPEESRSWSVGAVFTPRFLPELRFSIDYVRIRKVNEIVDPDRQFLIDNEDAFPGRIVRGPKLPGDPEEWAGPIVTLDATNLNIARTEVEAYDFQLDYVWRTQRFGEFSWNAIASWEPHYRNRTLPTYPLVDYVGYDSRPLEWRGNTSLSWARGPLTVGWNAQFYHSYFAFFAGSGATAEEVEATTAANREDAILNQGTARIRRQIYHDVIASYRFETTAGLLANSEISLGIQNVFDKSPPILASANPTVGGYSTYGDPRLRRYLLSFRKSLGVR